jgi:hypothetical protein
MRCLGITILILFVNGCSRTEFAYRNADWFLEVYAAKTVAASDEQIEDWRPTLDLALQRHRLEILPLIIDYLDLLERVSENPDDAKLAECVVKAGVSLYERHAQLAVDLAVPLLTTLDSSQARHLAEYMAKDLQKKHEKYLKPTPREQYEARVERLTEQTEKWTGKLTDTQRQVIEQTIRQIPDLSEYWLDYRARQTEVLLGILEKGPDTMPIRNHLSGWWVRFDQRAPKYVRESELAKQGFSRYLQRLGRSLTAKQKQRVQRKLAALRHDLESFLTPSQVPEKRPDALVCAATVSEALPVVRH